MLIDKERAIRGIKRLFKMGKHYCDEQSIIGFLNTIQPEQRTGKWIPQDHNKRAGNISTCVYYYPTCSECGQVGNETYKYCPHCGAKMTEGDAE